MSRAIDAFLRDVYGIEIEPDRPHDREIRPPRAPRVPPKVEFAFAVVRFIGQEIVVEK